MKKILVFIIALAIPLLVGGISAALSMKGMAVYGNMAKPPLSPPAWVFSVAWTILYMMMGAASYLIFTSEAEFRLKAGALTVYAVQLVFNFAWSIIFFNMGEYWIAFGCLFILWALVIFTTFRFYVISGPAACLMIPYVLWLTFAAYLNLGAAYLKM